MTTVVHLNLEGGYFTALCASNIRPLRVSHLSCAEKLVLITMCHDVPRLYTVY